MNEKFKSPLNIAKLEKGIYILELENANGDHRQATIKKE